MCELDVLFFRSPDGKVLMTTSNDNYMRMFRLPDSIFTNQWDVNVELVGDKKFYIYFMIRVNW